MNLCLVVESLRRSQLIIDYFRIKATNIIFFNYLKEVRIFMEHRIEKHLIKPTDKQYEIVLSLSRLTNNLYNHANFIVRQNFFL